jgi:hypothetical protein
MEPLDDQELKQLLQQWDAPTAPDSLRARVLPVKTPWWNWLVKGSVRVPVPVALAAALLLALWMYHSKPASPAPTIRPETVSLSDFKPVRQLQPVVVSGGSK